MSTPASSQTANGTAPKLVKGLEGVLALETELSFIDGQKGVLLYRGYEISDLAKNVSFEEVAYLLWNGELPNQSQLDELNRRLREERPVHPDIIDHLRHHTPKDAVPMSALRTVISMLGLYDEEAEDDSPEANLRKAIRLTAKLPTLVAAFDRIRKGLDPVAPKQEGATAFDFLYMLNGEEPGPAAEEIMDAALVLHAEHGVNASAFGARVAASTLADLHCAITTGIAVLKGPSHGGAAEEVMKMALEIGTEENAEKYVRDQLDQGGRVMGFGHRVYKAVDPRSLHLQDDLKVLGERKGEPKWYSILQEVIEVMQPYARRGICQNVDFFSGAIYYLLGIPDDLFISIFAMGRVPGWTVQVVEQFENNILLRPRLQYTGPMDEKWIPIEERG
ncbi:MAG: citrate (Si)-synthase [Bacteroidetes bacterium]|nr:citrate (Si)-synthase [Bacteroidota bacterium]